MNQITLRFLITSTVFAGVLGASVLAAEAGPELKAEDSLVRLAAGNKRFVAGTVSHPDQSAVRRTEVAGGQHPYAIVLACADSRLSPELIFDEGLGDLFVVRNAGNLLDDHVIASLEYAVEHLHVPLIVVLGHTKCGAVTAAVAGGTLPGHLPSIAESLAPAVAMAKKKPGDPVENAVRISARFSAAALSTMEPIIGEAVKEGRIKVVAARYDIATGQVEFLE